MAGRGNTPLKLGEYYLRNEVMSIVGLTLHCATHRRNRESEAYHRVIRAVVIGVEKVN
jgi:hypothetical protein